MNLQTKLFPWSVLLNIILAVALFMLFRALSVNSDSSSRDRNRLLEGNAHLKAELAKRDTVILRIQSDRATDSAKHASTQGSLKSQIRGLKRQLSENPGSLVIRDTIILKQDTLIADLETERDSLKISFREEIRVLGQSKLALEQAYDSTFSDLLRVNDELITTEKKLTRMEKIARVLGISTATLAVVVVVLAAL